MKTVEKKKKTTKVSDDLSPSVDKSGKGSSKKKKRDYKSRIPLSMSDLVFQSNVNTSVETSAKTDCDIPKPVSEVVETKAPTSDNPNSTENLGSAAEKKNNTTSEPVESEMQIDDTPTEIDSKTADNSPTIAEMVTEKSTHIDPEKDVMLDVETSLNEPEEAETADKETMNEAAVEKDVETTVTASDSSDEETGTAQEGTSDDEEDTQFEESNQSILISEKEKGAEKSLDAEKGKGEDVVDVDTYETTKPAERTTGGMTKRLRSSSSKAVPTASKTPAPRVKTKGVGPVKGWSKVFAPTSKKKETLKRKKESSSDSDYDAAEDVPNISSPTPKTKATAKKVPQNVEEAPCDNISFHRAAFALRWDYIYQRRLAVERELTKDALKCQDI
ncbi:putative envelope-like protein, partial [Trifolium pratense]